MPFHVGAISCHWSLSKASENIENFFVRITVFNVFLLKLRTTAPLNLIQVRKTVMVMDTVTGVTTASIHPMCCNTTPTAIVLVSKIIHSNGS